MAKTINDAGRKVPGARKDWKNVSLVSGDLEDMSDEEVAKHVRKDNVWPKPDYAALVDAGMPSVVAAAVKIVRDKVPQTSTLKGATTQRESREAFVAMVSAAQDMLLSCRSLEEVGGVYNRLKAEWNTKSRQASWYSVVRGKYSPFHLMTTDSAKAREMVAAGFPGEVEPWKKNLKVFGRGDGVVVYQSGRYLGTFASRDEAYDVLKSKYEAAAAKKTEEPSVPPNRPHLDFVTRTGLEDRRDGRDVSSEEFIEVFGFTSVEFGNWVPDAERQIMLNMAHDSLLDLAEVLGLEPLDISLGGRLSAGFGSRGHGGRRAAEYQPAVAVFHFTRMNGAGSLAHEYAHALDHFLGMGTNILSRSGVPCGTGWTHPLPSRVSDALAHRGYELATSFEDAFEAMKTRRKTRDDAIGEVQAVVRRFEAAISSQEKVRAKAEEEGAATVLRLVSKDIAENTTRMEGQLKRIEALREQPENFDFGGIATSFNSEALKLRGSYSDPAELFARAFECFVFDELAAHGANSDYLVHGVEEDRYADIDEWRGNPYPAGEERIRINGLIRTMVRHAVPVIEDVRHLAEHVNGR
jgi:hypothetical protein